MFNTENPVVRDKLWQSYSADEREGYDDEDAIIERAYDCLKSNCKGCYCEEYCVRKNRK